MNDYYYTRQKFDYNTDQSKRISFNGIYEFGPYYNGALQATTLRFRLAPIPNIALAGSYEYNSLKEVGEKSLNASKCKLVHGRAASSL